MNAHTPFDAKQDWSNPYCQNSSNDQIVDSLLGNAYHVVRTVYCNLGNLKLLYDLLNQYGMVLGVQSEAELKALTTESKYARIYGFSRAGDRQVTDYLYVEGDRTGIIPDDTTATGSWITVATSGSGGGTSSGGGAYIPWVYANGSATGGETTINVPDDTLGVPFIIVNGDMQYVGRGFEFNVENQSVTLAQPLEEGDEVVFLLTGTPAVPDNPNVSDWIQINWLYNGGYAVGGEQIITVPYTFQSVPAVYKNGLRLYKGLTTESYTADPDNQRIFLTEPLATNDRLIVQIGGEIQVLEASDHTLQEVARATNVKDSEVILSTDTTQFLNGKKIVYSVSEQKAYGLPVLPTNVYINSVSNGQLTYSPGNITVTLLDTFQQQNTRELWRRSLAEAGLTLVDGSFEAGGTLVNPNDVLLQESTGKVFSGPAGTYPANTNPALGSFVDRSSLLPGAGVVRNDRFALRDFYSVKDFGATGLGLVDESAAFSLAAINTPAINNIPGTEGSGMPRAPMCRIRVPEGTYLLTTLVDTGNKAVIWDVDANAKIIGAEFINGEIYRAGIRHSSGLQHGTTDYACGYSVRTNRVGDEGAEVVGISSPSSLANYPDRDSVGVYVDNIAPAALHISSSATYTGTTCTGVSLSDEDVKRLRKGMIIDTLHSTKYSGIIESWNADGSVLTVKDGWFKSGDTTPSIPDNSSGYVINPITKIWAHNANAQVEANSYAVASTGFELGLLNNKSNSTTAWGFDSVSLGTYRGERAFTSRGDWLYAYYVQGKLDGTPIVGLLHRAAGQPVVAQDLNGKTFFNIGSSGNMSVGSQGVSGVRLIDLYSNGKATYDCRIQVAGGSDTVAGQGALTFNAASINLGADTRPTTDNTKSLGQPQFRWAQVYAAVGTINTSDERSKPIIRVTDDAILDAWEEVDWFNQFKFDDAIALKGEDGARWHFGLIAQRVRDVFEKHGLNGFEYGILCHDEWDDQYQPVISERIIPETGEKETYDTGEMLLVKAAGDRYGIRYEEALSLEAALQRRKFENLLNKYNDLESRISALESK